MDSFTLFSAIAFVLIGAALIWGERTITVLAGVAAIVVGIIGFARL